MKESSRPRIIYNDDTYSLRKINPPHTVDKIDKAFHYLVDTQVDVLCWSMLAGQIAYSWPSKRLENYYDHRKEEHWGDKFTNEKNLMLQLHLAGIDYLPILIDKLQKVGICFFASFRMNDTHMKSKPQGILAGNFWRTHQGWRLWEIIDGQTYYNAAMDYSHAEVRQRMYDAICEVANCYDVDGIELDFCRNPYIFQPSEAWGKRKVLTSLIRKVRRLLNTIGEKRGRPLKLMIRLPFSEEKQHKSGMDVRSWVKDRLMDYLVMSSLKNDYDQSVEPWLKLCRESNIGFYPSIEANPLTNAVHNHVVDETVDECILRQRGMAQNFLAQGTDGVYMFNYASRLFESTHSQRAFKKLITVCSELGDRKILRGLPKQFTFWGKLPMQLETARPRKYHQTIYFTVRDTATHRKNVKTILRFRQVVGRNPHATKQWKTTIAPHGWIKYYINDKQVDSSNIKRKKQTYRTIPSGFDLPPHELIEISHWGKVLKDGENELAFEIPHFPKEDDPYIYIYELIVEPVA